MQPKIIPMKSQYQVQKLRRNWILKQVRGQTILRMPQIMELPLVQIVHAQSQKVDSTAGSTNTYLSRYGKRAFTVAIKPIQIVASKEPYSSCSSKHASIDDSHSCCLLTASDTKSSNSQSFQTNRLLENEEMERFHFLSDKLILTAIWALIITILVLVAVQSFFV